MGKLCNLRIADWMSLRYKSEAAHIIYISSKRTERRLGQQGSQSPRKGTKMNIARSFNNWRKYRQTVAELGRMSNRELSDLGIGRSEIQSVARAASGR